MMQGLMTAAWWLVLVLSGVAGAQPVAVPAGGTPQPPIADSRFPTWVDFEGDWAKPNGNYAVIDSVVSVREASFFAAGFFRPRIRSWGSLAAWNARPPHRHGQEYLLLTLDAGREKYATIMLHWVGPESSREPCCGLAGGLGPQTKSVSDTYGGTRGGYDLDTWQFIAGVVYGRCGRQVFVDGVWGENNATCKDWPMTLAYTTFGAYREGEEVAHPYRGGLRDWAIATGVPTTAELLRMRAGEDPGKIWGARLWGAWRFTTDPASGKKEPDLSGNGRDLTYTARNKATPLPTLVRTR